MYLYKDAHGTVIYVGKAKNLRSRVRSYFNDDRLADIEDRLADRRSARRSISSSVDNEKEALALENNLIKQWKPRYNILLRDDKTYPYIKLTAEPYPRVYVTRRLRKTGRLTTVRTFRATWRTGWCTSFIATSRCRPAIVDLTRKHTHPCLEFHIHRCLGPCVAGLTTDAEYADAVRARAVVPGRPAQGSGAGTSRPHGDFERGHAV